MPSHNSMTLSQFSFPPCFHLSTLKPLSFSKYGLQTSRISISWELLRNQLLQTYLCLVLWWWDSAICVLTSLPSNSDACSSLRITAISPIQLTKSSSNLTLPYTQVRLLESTWDSHCVPLLNHQSPSSSEMRQKLCLTPMSPSSRMVSI